MADLNYSAKWTVLDTENAEPDEANALIEAISGMSESDAINCIKEGLQVEVNGDMLPASDLDIAIGSVIVANDRVEIKNLELKWESDMDADEYIDEFGESIYMELEYEDICVPFMAWESFEIS